MSKPDLEQTERAWVIPILLGALLTVLSAWLVVIELAQPKSTATFRGIRFSNTINSAGARNTVYYFREQLDWLPRPFKDDFLSPTVYLANLRGIFIAMFLIQIAALILVRRGPLASPHLWAVGPAAACLALLLYPPTSTDIYAYASFGWVADEGSNPYTVVPKSILGDPYHTFNDWTHITTPYGPIWTWISQLLVHMSGQDPFWTTILFKLVATLSAFGLAYATLALAKRFTTDPRLQLTAFIYVLWSPILLFESAGPVHLDALMMLFAVTGLLVATGTKIRSPRLGLVIATGSALIKPATLPLLGLMGITRFNRADPWPIIIRRIAGDIVVVLATILLAYLAFIDSAFIHATDKMAHDVFIDRPMRSNPLWAWGVSHIDAVLHIGKHLPFDAGQGTRWLAIALFLYIAYRLTREILKERKLSVGITEAEGYQTNLRFMVWSWAAVTVVLSVLPLNAHAWYNIWPMAPLAVMWISTGYADRQRPPWWLIALQIWIIISFLVYHTYPKPIPVL